MRFTPKSKQELEEMNLLEPGKYHFEVVEAQDTTSKSGNDMIKLKLKIWDHDGRERIIFDYLLEQMAFKLRHFCETADLIHKYDSGSFNAEDCIGKCGIAEIIISIDKTGQYASRNQVKDYYEKQDVLTPVLKQTDEQVFDDDIPF